MLISLRSLALGLVAALTLSGSAVLAGPPGASAQYLAGSNQLDSNPMDSNPMGSPSMGSGAPQALRMIAGGSYSPSLGAEFRVENFFLPAHGQFTGVRLVSMPEWNSPLRTLGLQPGDVITRLDGVRVDNVAQLENHYSWTQVRYIKTGTQTVKIGNIFINQNNVGPQPGPFVPGGNAP